MSKTSNGAAAIADAPTGISKIEEPKTRRTAPIDPSKVQVGHLMCIQHYVKVQQVMANNGLNQKVLAVKDLDVVNPDGKSMEWERRGIELIRPMLSADQYAETVKLPRSEIVRLLMESWNRPFTVVFVKQDKDGTVGKGERRTLRGRLVEPDPIFGRSRVEDLDIEDPKKRLRLVTHLTVEELIVDGVRYVVK